MFAHKQQILVIHGADSFATYEEYIEFLRNFPVTLEYIRSGKKNWKSKLQEQLGEKCEVLLPSMPNKSNAKYLEWKIWFEKYIPLLEDGVILVGHSMGGVFLAKYLSEVIAPITIRATFLIAAPFDKDDGRSLVEFNVTTPLTKLEGQGGQIFLYHSKDDSVVDFSEFEKYQAALPGAHVRIFKDRDHFACEELPEILEDIRSL